MTTGAIPDESPRNLQEQLLLEDAKAGNCRSIQVGTDKLLRDAPRLVAIYGGTPEDWHKMTSNQAFEINGVSVQVHWFRNSQTLEDFEFKFKRQYPKAAPKNL
ncbi:hypothetical protein [Limnofasciculus baicalensis]|uniref:Uncharacterized protein n=1 Tax=Limnofasciculus baicalensis BBK-W-15 TaxID=2699891 RepID=A0AAE3GM62_9CYAN|nr:hypothetical protein [Limnofasciculus baicalensis]MCP2726919.1 hypothetical protein [Limnofasciculus baicalensis BBK-W-15]